MKNCSNNRASPENLELSRFFFSKIRLIIQKKTFLKSFHILLQYPVQWTLFPSFLVENNSWPTDMPLTSINYWSIQSFLAVYDLKFSFNPSHCITCDPPRRPHRVSHQLIDISLLSLIFLNMDNYLLPFDMEKQSTVLSRGLVESNITWILQL